MTNNKIAINRIAKTFGTALTIGGFKMIKGGYSNLAPTKEYFGFIKESFDKIKSIPITQLDYTYYFTDFENWGEMLTIIEMIIKKFDWEKEVFDCDNRAKLVSSLCSLFFGLNSCGEVYCEITNIKTGKKMRHWTNVIITSSGELYLFDVDNDCRIMKLEIGKPITMRYWNYNFLSARFS